MTITNLFCLIFFPINSAYFKILENLDLSIFSINSHGSIFEVFETNTQVKAEFTASIDKWLPDNVILDGDPKWMDGPIMKLHHKDIQDEVGIDLIAKDGHPGHKHKPDMDKGSYELRVEHDQDTDGAINIDDVMGVLSRSRGIEKNDEWRFYDKDSNTSLWDNTTKTNKMDIVLEEDNDIELSAILRGDVNASYDADKHDRAASSAPTPNPAPLPVNNDDELLTINPDIM